MEPEKNGKKKKKTKKKKKSLSGKSISGQYKNFFGQEPPNSGEQWTDNFFPPNDHSLIGDKGLSIDSFECKKKNIDPEEVEWKRANEIFPEPHLFEGEINLDNVIQGKVGNSYFLSALAALSKYPGLISKLFITKEYNPDGFYELLLFLDGEFQSVFVDDYFPCLKGTSIPYFAKPNNFELWVMLLEKAWAKVNGGYGNSISGFPNDIFKVLTGFSCEYLNLDLEDENTDRVWDIIKTVINNNGIICALSRDADDIQEAGLICSHFYIIKEAEEVEDDKHRKTCLLKLKNPLGKSNWNGDFSENSVYWTEYIKKQIKEEKLIFNEGEFFLNYRDLLKYFLRCDICQIIIDGYIKNFDFSQNELNNPQIFNVFLHQKANFSVSLIGKNWRYHREMRNVSHPTSLMIAEYDPSMKIIKKVHCSYESYADADKARILEPGFYLIWAYKGIKQSESPLPESMKVRIISGEDFDIKLIEPDTDFNVAKQIIYYGVKFARQKDTEDDIFYDVHSDFKRSGLGYRLIINPLNSIKQKWVNNTSDLSGYSLLPPFENQTKFEFMVNPNDFYCVIGIKDRKYGSFRFGFESDVDQYECKEDSEKETSKNREFSTFCLTDIESDNSTKEKTPTLEELTKNDDNQNIIDHAEKFADKYKDEYPLVKSDLITLEPMEGEKRLGWVRLENDKGVYLGEADYATPQGRGLFVFKNNGYSWLGYFNDGAKGNKGKLYDKEGNVIYDGEYKDGMKNGFGKYFYPNGVKYEGEFVDDKREGKGTLVWNDGSRWEGNFINNEMDGEGTYFDLDDSYPVTYQNGVLVK